MTSRTINTVRNVGWADAEHTALVCEVDFDELDDEFVPFSTSAEADTEHGLEIWQRANAGDYGVIAEYVAPVPSTDPRDYPLNKFQFESLVLGVGLSLAVIETAINGLPIPAFDKAVSLSRLRNAETYNRDHPLVEQVRSQINMSVADLDAAWLQAAALH